MHLNNFKVLALLIFSWYSKKNLRVNGLKIRADVFQNLFQVP